MMCNMLRDNNGQPLLPPSHACVSAMEKNMKTRCEHDNYAYNTFHILYEDPSFLPMRDDLTGFDLVAGCYGDDDGEQCNFKMLQIVSKA
eukprot:10511607-Ditylum_brightwellii.AAC.1